MYTAKYVGSDSYRNAVCDFCMPLSSIGVVVILQQYAMKIDGRSIGPYWFCDETCLNCFLLKKNIK
jgi:hypothetical protein